MSSQISDFPKTYSSMRDDELLRLDADNKSLLDEARLALKEELRRRGISPSPILSEPENPELAEYPRDVVFRRVGPSRWARLGIFVILGVIFTMLVVFVFGSRLNPTAEEALGKMAVSFALGGWGLLEVVAGRWLTIKRTWVIAIAMYLLGLTWVAAVSR